MLDHIGLRTIEPNRMITFYEAALAPLGITKLTGWGRRSIGSPVKP